MDCGPTCLRMVAKFYGKHFSVDGIRQKAGFGKEGVSLLGLSDAAEQMGLHAKGVQLDVEALIQARLPCILHWDRYHFVVLLPFSRWRAGRRQIQIADPAKGIITLSKAEFLNHWLGHGAAKEEGTGIALLLEPSSRFQDQHGDEEKKLGWPFVWQYLRPSRWPIVQVFIALILSSLLQLVFPFLAQSIVDVGINARDLQYITIVLGAQLMLLFSRSVVDFIRSRLLLRISTVVNISLLSDFWLKLTRLPISYFDSYHTGDTLQRIGDNRLVQNFLTTNALNIIFSLLNFVVYATVLFLYDARLFAVFATGAITYFLWVRLFLRIRRKINYQTFHISAKENTATLQLVQGMQEIRLNNAEHLKRWEWEKLQVGIFRLGFKGLTYTQVQQAGAVLINQGKDIVITFMAAGLVVQNQLTLGAMLAIQYIIGQLSSPVEQFVGFAQSAQDAKISLERLNEIHQLKDEEGVDSSFLHALPADKSIHLQNLSFAYAGAGNDPVLSNLHLSVREGQVTAIVGASGSGKTTLLKVLLKSYDHYTGNISIGQPLAGTVNLRQISPSFWRSQCGVVLQDGYIFNDTIARNIAVADQFPDQEKLVRCCETANILTFIESLPNGFETQLGADGMGISQGQRQRLLIARAIYKDPAYIFLDEATNALDANNERAIVENLRDFFKGKTVVVVAHRLSTVRDADKIVVLHEGRIAEEGTHHELCLREGRYFELVRNQLELSD